jgi:hypothetical protein
MKFKGKVSWWFYAIIIGVAALVIPIIIVSAFVDTNVVALIINLVVLVAVELFCIPIVFHNFVELQNETLLIAFGFIKKKIPYSDIVALSATNNPLSSLGASFDRIEIKCKSEANTMISIIDKERFFHEMKKYNSDITIM